jgi:hypothetical protein
MRRALIVWSAFLAGSAGAQMPGVPVLQNAWASPGIVGALNMAGGDGSIYAAAAAWSPASARFQLSGGIGLRSRSGQGSKSVYGVRAAIPFGGASSDFGFGAFGGVGGGQSSSSGASGSATTDTVANTTVIPVGIAIGWRHSLGAMRGFSVYATPAYLFFSGGTSNTGLVRTAVGADIGISRALGVTAGVEFGQNRTRGEGGPSGTLYGLGVSYAVGRR